MSADNMTQAVIDLTSDEEDHACPSHPLEKRRKVTLGSGNSSGGEKPLNSGMHDRTADFHEQCTLSIPESVQHDDNIRSPDSISHSQHATKGNQMPGGNHEMEKNGFHQFWKAGEYAYQSTEQGGTRGGVEHIRVHPKFLHSNATSHKWAFGAIAELLDNAVDETRNDDFLRLRISIEGVDVASLVKESHYPFWSTVEEVVNIQNGATYVKVDQIFIGAGRNHALLFQDDGGGMDPASIRQCMSLGYSSKRKKKSIGQYGNGFKTSTMRLGADVIVFTRTDRGRCSTQSIGLLSYTFLRMTGQDDIIVPMLDFDIQSDTSTPRKLIYDSECLWNKNLATILKWTPFSSESNLMKEFDDIGSHGTKIIIYNLWLNHNNILELDFDTDDKDIRLRGETKYKQSRKEVNDLLDLHISSRLRYSLRAYASVLYLRKMPNFQIILRGKPVEHYSIGDDLKFSKKVTYRPQVAPAEEEMVIVTTIGFTKEAPLINVHGFNIYHKNRLIMPFLKVFQDNSSRGRGVIGVLEANLIEPAHDKQDFERTVPFLRLESKLRQMTLEYWKSTCDRIGYKRAYGIGADSQGARHSVQSPCPLASYGPHLLPQQDAAGEQATATDVPNAMAQQNMDATNLKDTGDDSLNLRIHQLKDENIQLFMRCEQRRQREMELNQMVAKLKNELKIKKLKYDQLLVATEQHRKRSSGNQPVNGR